MEQASPYPRRGVERDRWILERRPTRNSVDPYLPYAFLVEDERSAAGEVVPVATIFLTNRECPWRCVMCDLWMNTLRETVPVGAIPRQIEYALARLPPGARQLKLYNSGSFFDAKAIPLEDYGATAEAARPFERVIVESHPSLVGEGCLRFRDLLGAQMEVAMGLETAHPEALERLNKGLTLGGFAAAAERLWVSGIALRVFVLVQPPFVRAEEALTWAQRSLDFAFACNATAVTLIPTRAGNGAMDVLRMVGESVAPRMSVVEAALEYGLALGRGRVFVDLWDVAKVVCCGECRAERSERLRQINLRQETLARVVCERCGGDG